MNYFIDATIKYSKEALIDFHRPLFILFKWLRASLHFIVRLITTYGSPIRAQWLRKNNKDKEFIAKEFAKAKSLKRKMRVINAEDPSLLEVDQELNEKLLQEFYKELHQNYRDNPEMLQRDGRRLAKSHSHLNYFLLKIIHAIVATKYLLKEGFHFLAQFKNYLK